MIMYSIDPKQLIIKNATGIVHDYSYDPVNPYDLKNLNTYAESGELIEEVPPHVYDRAFSGMFVDINPIYQIEDFLNHHFERTPDKKLFLKHIGRQIIPLYFDRPIAKHQAIKKEILQWVDQKEKEILETAIDGIELISLGLFLLHKSNFNAPAKNDIEKWADVLHEFGFSEKLKPSSIGQTYNGLVNDNLKNGPIDKHYEQAEKLFKNFPDEKGLSSLLSAYQK